MVWRDLVDAVHHACRRFLGGWAFQMGLPTTWKGDGRVESRQLLVDLGTVQVFHSVEVCISSTGLLKPVCWQQRVVSLCVNTRSE